MATLTLTEQLRLGTVRAELMQGLLSLMNAAESQYGYRLAVPADGGTRSVERQAALYQDALAQGGGADTAYAVAAPGHSRHNYGAAFDLHIIAGGQNDDGTGSDADYAQLAALAESLSFTPGLTAGYYFADRGLGKTDPFHFQLNEPFQTSVDRWNALVSSRRTMLATFGVVALAVLVASRW